MDEEIRQKLNTLIGYWIEHNQEHEQEWREWADKASTLGEAITQPLLQASASLAEATIYLEKARQALSGL
jgi:fibrillarin-like rRNA methylase